MVRSASVLVAVLVAGACQRDGPPAIVVRQLPERSVLAVPPGEMPRTIAEEFRLKPDRRFLIAAAELERLVTGRSPDEVSAEYAEGDGGAGGGGEWRIRSGREDIGSLPPLPGFRNADSLLAIWARRLSHRVGWQLRPGAVADSIQQALNEFAAPRVAQALQAIDREWRSAPHAGLLALAAQGLVALTIQLEDQLELADHLGGKALAATALARALGGHADPRDAALLASALGYSVEAAELAQALPDSEPVRRYLLHDTPSLSALARRPDAEQRTRFLYLRRLADERNVKAWQDWMAEMPHPGRPTSGVLGTGLAANRFELDSWVPARLARVVADELDQALERGGWWTGLDAMVSNLLRFARPARPLHRFERDADALSDRLRGPFLDGRTYAAYFRGHMYSTLYAEATHNLVGLASVDAAERFARGLAGASAGVAAALAVWTDRSAQYMAGKLGVIDLVADLDTLAFPGEPAMERTFEEMVERLPYADPRVFAAARRLATAMDTRVPHQAELAWVAVGHLLDLNLAERHYRRVVELATPDYPGFAIWYARYRGADTTLVRMLHDTSLTENDRGQALKYLLADKQVDHAAVRKEFQRLILSAPDRWSVRADYVKYLEGRRDYAAAVPIVSQWLAAHEQEDGFDVIYARTALARLYDEMGRPAEAWPIVEPVIPSYQAGALRRGALILAHLGRDREADQLARRLVDRYPALAWARAVLAEVAWQAGDYERAGAALRDARRLLAPADWRDDIGEAFVRVFGAQPLTRSARAFETLARAGIPAWELERIAEAAAKAGRNDIAFTLQSQLEATASAGSLEIPLKGYGYLAAWRGKGAALAWLKTQLPSARLNEATMAFYRERQHDLLWDLIEDPGPGDLGTFVWLLRAAASLERGAGGSGEAGRRAQLLAYYRHPRTDPYHVMGRYLVGMADERSIIELATTPDRRCEVAYYIGVKAKSEGRYRDASDWFRIARETEQRREGEYVWATDWAYRWAGEGKSLSRLGRQ